MRVWRRSAAVLAEPFGAGSGFTNRFTWRGGGSIRTARSSTWCARTGAYYGSGQQTVLGMTFTSVLHFDNNTRDANHTTSVRKPLEVDPGAGIGTGGWKSFEGPAFTPKDFGWDSWQAGHYWFTTIVDSHVDHDDGNPRVAHSFGEYYFEDTGEINDADENMNKPRITSQASGGGKEGGSAPVTETIRLSDSYNMDVAKYSGTVGVRTWLYVDADGKTNNKDGSTGGSLQFELVAQGPLGADQGIHWNATLKNGSATSPNFTPGQLRYRDGTLPRCDAAGRYDPNGSRRCTLKEWPTAHYGFNTLVKLDEAHGGDLNHKFTDLEPAGDVTESWSTTTEPGVTTSAAGNRTAGDGAYTDQVLTVRDKNNQQVKDPNKGVRSWLMLDHDGRKNNKPDGSTGGSMEYELVAFGSFTGGKTGQAGGKSGARGDMNADHYAGVDDKGQPAQIPAGDSVRWNTDLSVSDPKKRTSPGFIPQQLRYRDGSLPKCNPAGGYDPNGSSRCVLTRWPSGHYGFNTKVSIHPDEDAWSLFKDLEKKQDYSESWTTQAPRLGVATLKSTTPSTATQQVTDRITITALKGSIAKGTKLIVTTTLHRADGKQKSKTQTITLNKAIAQGASDAVTSNPFTPGDLGENTWRTSVKHWFDVTVVTAMGDAVTATHAGQDDGNESFTIPPTGAKLSASTTAYQGNAKANNASPVTDTLTLTGMGLTDKNTTVRNVRFTLHYATKAGQAAQKSASKTVVGPRTGLKVTSSPFTPSDLFGSGNWRAGHYWFDVTVAKGDVTVNRNGWTIHPDTDITHTGKDDRAEQFDITPVQPLSTQITLHAEKHWDPKASKKKVKDFQAKFTDDATGKSVTVNFNSDKTATSAPYLYFEKDLGKTFTYTITEVGAGTTAQGVKYDSTTHKATVKVEKVSDTKMQAVVTYDGKGANAIPVFTNTYTPTPDSVVLKAHKDWSGKGASKKDITSFQVALYGNKAGTGKPLQTKSFDRNGVATFDKITYTAAGPHEYAIREVIPSGDLKGVKYDPKVTPVTVTVKDDGYGRLSHTVTPTDDASFTWRNTYTPSPTSVQVKASKLFTRDALSKADITGFTFDLYANKTGTGNPIQSKKVLAKDVKNTGASTEGDILFDTITYTPEQMKDANGKPVASKNFDYTVREKAGTAGGVAYDKAVFHFTVPVTDDGEGHLTTPRKLFTPDGQDGRFDNVYTPADVSIPFKAHKELKTTTGEKLAVKAGQFTFDLKDGNGKTIATKSNDAKGLVDFGTPVTVTSKDMDDKPKWEHDYTITEREGTDPFIQYDTTPRKVHVVVEDDGIGHLKVTSVTYDGKPKEPTIANEQRVALMLPMTGGRDIIRPAVYGGVVMLAVLLIGATVVMVNRRKPERRGRHS